MQNTNFFTKLVNVGIRPQEATILETQFQNEPEFTEGLEVVATWVSLKQIPPVAKPKGQPWLDIYDGMLESTQAGIDLDSAYVDSLKPFALSTDVQMALSHAISVRMKAILDFESSKNNKKRFKTVDYVNQLKLLGYNFKLNDLNDDIEVNGYKIDDIKGAEIRTKMRDSGFYKMNEVEDAYLTMAGANRYHPIKDFLNSLTYDGGDYIAELASYFTDKYGVFGTWLRRWLIGACAKVFEAEQNRTLILDGFQGIGKSDFVKWIGFYFIPDLKKYFIEEDIKTEDKDFILRLSTKLVWEVKEFGVSTRKVDYEALKGFLSTRQITVRKPYGHHDIEKDVMCSFIGTINNSTGIFADPTGSRRYMVSHLTAIDWTYRDLDPIKLWGEAMAAYLAGENWNLVGSEYDQAKEINTEYDVDDPIEDVLKKYFYINPQQKSWWLPTTDILHVIEDQNAGNIRGSSRANAMRLATIMTKLGLEKVRNYNSLQQRVNGYCGITYGNIP